MALLWQCLCAALLPIGIRDIPFAIDRYIQHLGRCETESRERQADAFHRHFLDGFG
jgi:hypothetical protein